MTNDETRMTSQCQIPKAGGVILLEVLFALTLFFIAAGVVTGSLHTSMRAATLVKMTAKASDLAVTKLSEMQVGLQTIADTGPTPWATDGDLSQWTWQIATTPVDSMVILNGPTALRVEIIIRKPSQDFTYRLTQVLPPTSDESDSATQSAGVVP